MPATTYDPRLVSVLAALLWVQFFAAVDAAEPITATSTRGHSHNDYWHSRPLQDALDAGFHSIEADVFLVDGKLLVGHAPNELSPDRTLDALYLMPLARRLEADAGQVEKPGHSDDRRPQLTLLVDIKTDAEATYSALRDALRPYAKWLLPPQENSLTRPPLRIIVSGNRPYEAIARDTNRLVGIDGRPGDLQTNELSADVMPWVSESWPRLFLWRGEGTIPEEEMQRLEDLVATAHA
ncbi:MAG: hypothetical protein KDA61_21080, partial [Planctomycetales bacterium]|nr:hypothetical protein [Planctomycetales bacterium]